MFCILTQTKRVRRVCVVVHTVGGATWVWKNKYSPDYERIPDHLMAGIEFCYQGFEQEVYPPNPQQFEEEDPFALLRGRAEAKNDMEDDDEDIGGGSDNDDSEGDDSDREDADVHQERVTRHYQMCPIGGNIKPTKFAISVGDVDRNVPIDNMEVTFTRELIGQGMAMTEKIRGTLVITQATGASTGHKLKLKRISGTFWLLLSFCPNGKL